MKCQNIFSRKGKKNIINLLSSELAQRVVKVKAPSNSHVIYFRLEYLQCFLSNNLCKYR